MLIPTVLCAMITAAAPPVTVAEASDYTQTATYDQVVEFCDTLAAQSPLVNQATLGRTVEGRDIPMLILADPPVTEADLDTLAPDDPRVRFFAFGNIHAGEVCGKEALLALCRDIALQPDEPAHRALLDDLIMVFAPIYNADGNERFDDCEVNRPGQIGPQRVGQRPNAQNLDLNRDYIKLEAPETRALVQFLTDFDPHLTVDTHTTNGSLHRYTLTYDYPLNPNADAALTTFARDEMLPAITQRLRDGTGYDTFFYGNLNRDKTRWATYGAGPRYGGPYMGLRNQLQILSEAYSYAPYRDRVLATYAFTYELAAHAAEHGEQLVDLHHTARETTITRGGNPQPDDLIGIRHTPAAAPELITFKTYEEDGETPRDVVVQHYDRFIPTRSVRRPFAYIIDNQPGMDVILNNLHTHGIATESFRGEALVETYTITEARRAERSFQGHHLRQVEADSDLVTHVFEEGAVIIYTAQPLGTLLVYMLEPESEDGLVAWNFFDDFLDVGSRFPVHRVRAKSDVR